jgi:TolB-like protein
VEENDGDLMGDGVNIASRLEGIAKPGAICLSEDAYRQVKGRLEMSVSHLGATQLKNIAEPVRVYSVEVGKLAAPRKAMPVVSRLFPALAALAAILVVVGAAGWYIFVGKPLATAPPAATATSSSFGPTVAVLPVANATRDAKNDPLALRIGQKTTDYLGKYTWLRTIGRAGGAAKSGVDSVAGARELGADYVVTADLDSGADSPRATFHVDDAHSGARVWSRTLTPILEDPKSGAAEEEIAGSAGSLMKTAIYYAELTRAKAKKDEERTTYDCVLLGWSFRAENTSRRLRDCLEAASQREPSNPNVWEALGSVLASQRFFGGDCRPRRRASKSAIVWRSGSCRRRCAPSISRLSTLAPKAGWRMAITPSANWTAFGLKRRKRWRSTHTTSKIWVGSEYPWRSPAFGTKGRPSLKRRSGWLDPQLSGSGGWRRRSDTFFAGNTRRPMKRFCEHTKNRLAGVRISTKLTSCRSLDGPTRPRSMSRRS